MHKPVIAIDCDDVIVGTAPAVIANYNATYGTSVLLSDYYGLDVSVWGTDDATAIKRVQEYQMTAEFQQMPPFKEAIDVITKLADHYELHVVTGRHDFLAQATSAMLQEYFPDIFKVIEFTNYFSDSSTSKATVCSAMGARYLIDDHLHHANVVAQAGIEVLLFGDYPWNQAEVLAPNITRVKDWHAVQDILLGSSAPGM